MFFRSNLRRRLHRGEKEEVYIQPKFADFKRNQHLLHEISLADISSFKLWEISLKPLIMILAIVNALYSDFYVGKECFLLAVGQYLSDGRCNSSSDKPGVLMAIKGHGSTLPVGGMRYHRQRVSPRYYCTHQGSEIPLTYRGTRGAVQWDEIYS
ncbi:hypothetical protein AVEN_218894-1 [Araneus ventricosus]|uniref:Uncharacterized protein n=1 Tax=Araneus ventricosus TaxID=182803 RepID=A0A4Y2M511_ARAVE|nr:hypothetical protein AVEN_218894-1 [Araneus ventricosus]